MSLFPFVMVASVQSFWNSRWNTGLQPLGCGFEPRRVHRMSNKMCVNNFIVLTAVVYWIELIKGVSGLFLRMGKKFLVS